MTIREAIDVVISHNAQVAIIVEDANDKHYSNTAWEGMAHEIPDEYLDREFKPISDYVRHDKIVDHPLHLKLK